MPDAPALTWRPFHLARHGHRPDEYEDAFAGDPLAGRFAVADGAAESSYAGLWAALLVQGFVRDGGPRRDGPDWLAPLRRRWAAEVDGRPLPWYAEEKRALGAFATFLGLCVKATPEGVCWRALAVGDSCLVQLRACRSVEAFPLTHAADFGNRPGLIGSRAAVGPEPLHAHGGCAAGDRLLLMTDALAQWFLHEHEAERQPAAAVAQLLAEPSPDAAFADWVEHLRREELRNDDVTLLIIDL